MLLNIEDIQVNGNVRLTESNIENLARSMKSLGQITAIQVTFDQEDNGWHLVSGHRRLAAAKLLKWDEIRAEEVAVENDLAVRLAENIARDELTAYEMAQGVLALKETGMNQSQISDALGLAKSDVSELQKIAKGTAGIDPMKLNNMTIEHLEFYGDLHDMPADMREDFIADHDKPDVGYWDLHGYVEEVKEWRWTQKKENKPLIQLLEAMGAVPMSREDKFGAKYLDGPGQVQAHQGQPCHGWIINTSWSAGEDYVIAEYCLDPASHAAAANEETGEVDELAKHLRQIDKEAAAKGISGTNQDKREQKERQARKIRRKGLVKAFADKPLMKPLIDMVFTVLLDIQKPYRWNELGKAYGLTKESDTFHFDWDPYLSQFNAKDQVTQMLILAVGSVYIQLESNYTVSGNPTLEKLDRLFKMIEEDSDGEG